MRGRRLELPADWTTVGGLWIQSSGLVGTVLTSLETILTFEQAKVIEVDVRGWSIVEIIECLVSLRTPRFAQPQMRDLTRGDLQPLLDARELHQIDALRLMSLVRGWTP